MAALPEGVETITQFFLCAIVSIVTTTVDDGYIRCIRVFQAFTAFVGVKNTRLLRVEHVELNLVECRDSNPATSM